LPERKHKTVKESEPENGGASSRGFWTGTIAFGLVSVPVSLYPANRSSSIALRMVDQDGVPLQRRYYCTEDDRPLTDQDIVRGFEIERDRYVVVTDEELKALAPEKSREIDLRRFVDVREIDPFYFDRAYYLVPAQQGPSKAYSLLTATMEESGRAGIATFVMRDREYLVAILAEGGVLRAETMRFPDELRSAKEVGLAEPASPPATDVQVFERAIEGLSGKKLSVEELVDHRAEGLRKLAERKRAAGKDVVPAPEDTREDEGAQIIDLMAVLKRSLAQRKPPRAVARKGRTEKSGKPATAASKRNGGDLEKQTRAELYARAQALDIAGRAAMSKRDLIAAIRKAG